jgi:3-hydroxyacyl-CoA dehydrogenase
MGHGFAMVFAQNGFKVFLNDTGEGEKRQRHFRPRTD